MDQDSTVTKYTSLLGKAPRAGTQVKIQGTPSRYLPNLKHSSNQRDLIGFYVFPSHPPILSPTDASPPLPPTTMAPAHLKLLTLPSATLQIFHTMTQFLHTLKQLPLCNSRTQPLGSETSDAPLQNPPLLLHLQTWLQSGAIRLHSQNEYQLFGANIPHLPPPP